MSGQELAELFREHVSLAYRVAFATTGSSQDAEDAVQEAFLRVLRARDRLDPTRNVRAYVARAATNAARELVRARARRSCHESAAPPKENAMPREDAQAREERAALRGALATLAPEYRLPFVLRHAEGFTVDEAATALSLPRSTVEKRSKKARALLRRALGVAGFTSAAPATLLGVLPRVEAPAALADKLGAALSSAKAAGTGAAALKGGIVMKLIAGIVLAGAVAGAVTMSLPKQNENGPEPLPAETPVGVDLPPDQKYTMGPIVNGGAGKHLDGPAGSQAESTSLTKGHNIDDVGNIYWTECQYAVIRHYLEETKRVVTLTGSAQGILDGPLSRARFGGWSYNSTNLMAATADGKHVFVLDRGAGQWRHVDLEAGMVSTLGQWHHFKNGIFIIARDRCGEVYAFVTSGQDPPDCKGYKKLKVAPFQGIKTYMGLDHCALDVEKMRFYWHARGAPKMCDLKTGKITQLTSTGNLRAADTSGPFAGMKWHCPTGMSISPGGRYLYVGGGDSSSFYRMDLEKKYIHIFAYGGEIKGRGLPKPLEGGPFSFQDGTERDKKCGLGRWPAAGAFNNLGYGAWATAYGPLYKIAPVE